MAVLVSNGEELHFVAVSGANIAGPAVKLWTRPLEAVVLMSKLPCR